MTTKLQALRDLLEKATPGPWEMSDDGHKLISWRAPERLTYDRVAYVDELDPNDLRLIAALRNSADMLLDVVEAAVAWSKAECGGPAASTHGRTCDAEHHFQCPIEITAMRLCTTLSKLEELP